MPDKNSAEYKEYLEYLDYLKETQGSTEEQAAGLSEVDLRDVPPFNPNPNPPTVGGIASKLWGVTGKPLIALSEGAVNTVTTPLGVPEPEYAKELREAYPTVTALGEALPYEAAGALLGGAALKGAGKAAQGAYKYLLPGKAKAVLAGIERLIGKAPKSEPPEGLARPALDAMRSNPESGARLAKFLKQGEAPLLEPIPQGRPSLGQAAFEPKAPALEPTAPIQLEIPTQKISTALESAPPTGKPGNLPLKAMTATEAEAAAGGGLRPGEPLMDYFRRITEAIQKQSR